MRRDRLFLLDIAAACAKVARFIEGRTFGEFVVDEVLFAATVRNLHSIGEAARYSSSYRPSPNLNPKLYNKHSCWDTDDLFTYSRNHPIEEPVAADATLSACGYDDPVSRKVHNSGCDSWRDLVCGAGQGLSGVRPRHHEADLAVQARAKRSWEDNLLTWNKDHTAATLIISTYFGGLNGTGYLAVVRKFGDDWVVVSMKMAYVS